VPADVVFRLLFSQVFVLVETQSGCYRKGDKRDEQHDKHKAAPQTAVTFIDVKMLVFTAAQKEKIFSPGEMKFHAGASKQIFI
jgi:hypothetical protein